MRPSCSRCHWNDPRIGERLRRTDPYLATADASGRRGFETQSNDTAWLGQDSAISEQVTPLGLIGSRADNGNHFHPFHVPREKSFAWTVQRLLRVAVPTGLVHMVTPLRCRQQYDGGAFATIRSSPGQ